MAETPRFFLFLAVGTGAAAAAILALRSRRVAIAAARVVLWLFAAAASVVFLERSAILGGILKPAPLVEQVYSSVHWIVLGIGAAAAILSRRRNGMATETFVRSPLLPWGLCLFAALSYLAIEAGKLAHDAEMREFWIASAYPVWTMYAVMAAEVLGAAGLLVPRTRVWAAAGLSLLMLGAIGTHAKNGDPFSDSLDAVRMLVMLAAIMLLSSRSPGKHISNR